MTAAIDLWKACEDLLPEGWGMSSEITNGVYRVRVYDQHKSPWIIRTRPTFDEAMEQVRLDLLDMPASLRGAA